MKKTYICMICKTEKETEKARAVCEDCVWIGSRQLTSQQYIDWLEHNLTLIKSGRKLVYHYSDQIGDKDMHCSWGMCNNDLESWPDRQTWQHPKHTQPTKNGDILKIQTVDNTPSQWCPFDNGPDMDKPHISASHGCFYRCDFFQNKVQIHYSREDSDNPPIDLYAQAAFENILEEFQHYKSGIWDELPWAHRVFCDEVLETRAKQRVFGNHIEITNITLLREDGHMVFYHVDFVYNSENGRLLTQVSQGLVDDPHVQLEKVFLEEIENEVELAPPDKIHLSIVTREKIQDADMHGVTAQTLLAIYHPYTCACNQCLRWWYYFVDDKVPFPDYGPFMNDETGEIDNRMTRFINKMKGNNHGY